MKDENNVTASGRGDARAVVAPTNGTLAAMIDAEVNEGGPPSPIPCDTPVEVAAGDKLEHIRTAPGPRAETPPDRSTVVQLPPREASEHVAISTLLQSSTLQLLRLVVPAGKASPPYRAPGELTIHCLDGHVAFCHRGEHLELHVGELAHLHPGEVPALSGVTDSSVLVTLVRRIA